MESDAPSNAVDALINGGEFVFFFGYAGEVYGTNETGRVLFAKMKDPKDPDNTDGWRKTAVFPAQNLTAAVVGRQDKRLFRPDDVTGISVISSPARAKAALTGGVQ